MPAPTSLPTASGSRISSIPQRKNFGSQSRWGLARLWPSGSVAERIGNAFLERWAEFLRLAWMAGHGKTLFLPEVSPYSGECIAEGGAAFVIPGRAHNGPACLRVELCGEQGHEGE